jgi:DNA mismatch repair protein MutL
MSTTPRSIQLLPEHLIDQIKAGEVIERPASLIKELLENALDANATDIKIHLIENGLELIQIEDNGHGMSFDQLPLAFCRHATSKIDKFEHLYDLHSYGFRGEALASMAAVARITCVSAPEKDNQNGGRLVIHGGKTISHSEHQSSDSGTAFYIKDLFYNTPARLKFIKSKNAEKNGLKRILNAFFLCAPETQFTLRWDEGEKQLFNAVGKDNYINRVSQVLLKSRKPNPEALYNFDEIYEDHRVVGFFSRESSRGHAHKRQYLFANNRLFFDRGLHQTIIRSMEKLWGPGHSGHYCVFITTPPGAIDVNVHPHKTQIKFYKSSLIFSLLNGAIKSLISKQASQTSNSLEHERQTSLTSSTSQYDMDHYETFKDSPYGPETDSTQWQKTSLNLEDQSSLILLSRLFALYQYDERKYLIHIGILFAAHLSKNIIDKAPLPESQLTPLLISEPYKISHGPIDEYLSQLKDYALEIDRLDDKTLVLRGIPREIENFNYRLIVGELLNRLNRPHTAPLEERLYHFFQEDLPKWPQSFPGDQETLKSTIIQLCTSPTEQAGIKMIDDKALNKLFQAND